MADSIRIRAQLQTDGSAQVKVRIQHPMETGQRKDKESGKLVPAHYIQQIRCEMNGKPVMNADWGPGIAKNPYLSFNLKQAHAGDRLKIAWIDNLGQSDSVETLLESPAP